VSIDSDEPMSNVPVGVELSAVTLRASSIVESTLSASGRNRLPESVEVTRFARRSNRGEASSRSNARICVVTLDCTQWTLSAVRVKCSSSASALKIQQPDFHAVVSPTKEHDHDNQLD
jgi:hypothetical protein